MKIFVLLLVVVVISPCYLFSQHGWQAGVKGGISIPKLRAPGNANSSYSSGFETVVGPQAGVLAEYRFSPLFSLQTEFNYSTQGGEKNGEQRIRTSDFKAYIPAGVSLPNYLYANFNNKISLVYLELPVMAKFSYKVASNYRFSFYGGPYVGYLIKAEGEASGRSKIFTDPNKTQELSYNGFALGVVDFERTEDILTQLNRFNYGLQGGASLEYIRKRMGYFLALGGNYGFKRLQKDENFGDNKTGGLTIGLGVTHKL